MPTPVKYSRLWWRQRPHLYPIRVYEGRANWVVPAPYCDPCARTAMVSYRWNERKKRIEERERKVIRNADTSR